MFGEALIDGYMTCYFPLAAQFRTQEEPAFCGLTTLVMVLNALGEYFFIGHMNEYRINSILKPTWPAFISHFYNLV